MFWTFSELKSTAESIATSFRVIAILLQVLGPKSRKLHLFFAQIGPKKWTQVSKTDFIVFYIKKDSFLENISHEEVFQEKCYKPSKNVFFKFFRCKIAINPRVFIRSTLSSDTAQPQSSSSCFLNFSLLAHFLLCLPKFPKKPLFVTKMRFSTLKLNL